jgi:hypothetical protein
MRWDSYSQTEHRDLKSLDPYFNIVQKLLQVQRLYNGYFNVFLLECLTAAVFHICTSVTQAVTRHFVVNWCDWRKSSRVVVCSCVLQLHA